MMTQPFQPQLLALEKLPHRSSGSHDQVFIATLPGKIRNNLNAHQQEYE